MRLHPFRRRALALASLATVAVLGSAAAAPRKHAPPLAEPAPSSESASSPPTLPPARAQLTLEAALQRTGERLLRGADPLQGAVVAIDPRTGRLLAFTALSRGAGNAEQILTRARLPAASLFKLVTTTALFETSALTLHDRVCIDGGVRGIERRHLEPARGPRAECGPFAYALGHSKNAVYAQLATRLLSRDALLSTAERLGFNQPLPFDAGSAELGKLSVPYSDLAFARTAAGFEGSTLSPLGAAYLATLIARAGEPIALHLREPAAIADLPPEPLDASRASDVPSPDASPAAARPFSRRTAERLTRMLEVTVETGTSRAAFTAPDGKRYLRGIRVAGKTGTLRPDQGGSMTSWFVGFAPSRSPEVVVTVMLVNSRVYRRKANELARDLLRAYFRAHGRAETITDPFEPPKAAPALAAASAE